MAPVLRPPQHETDDQGEALLQTIIARLKWTANKIGKDYGRDFEVEIFRDGKSTGLLFNVQLKSTVKPRYSKENDFISVTLKARNALYLAKELRIPTFVVQADVVQNRLFWSAPQLDEALCAKLAKNPHPRECTVRVAVRNELPATKAQLVETIGLVATLLASKRLMEIESASFIAATSSVKESAELSRSLRDKSDAIDLITAQKVTASGDFDSARQSILTVLASPQSSVESKFFAVLVQEKNERLACRAQDEYRADHLAIVLATVAKLRELTRKGPGALKFYVLISQVAAEFYRLVKEDWGLFQNWRVHQATGDLWWRAELRVLRAEVSRRILRKYRQFIRLVRLSEKTPYQSALPLAFLRIVEGAAILICGLELDGSPDAAALIRESVFEVCRLAATIATQYGQHTERAQAALSAGMLSRDRSAACVHWAEEQVERIADEGIRERTRAMLTDQSVTLANEAPDDEAIPISMEQQIYENMASGLGIDLADRGNPISEMVRTGITDFDPTRALRDCSHMFVTLSRRSPGLLSFMLAQQLQLPTMGAKVIHCTLHEYAREGVSLNETYQRFRKDYCNQCPDRSPRDPGWQYTHAWQLEQNEQNKEFMNGPRRPMQKPVPLAPPIPQPGNACAACGLEFGDAGAPWWCGHCQTWFCQRQECIDGHEKHPWPY
ncbi:MAG: DUF4365 domain-containing protein [Candidatus Sulfotelmatobacter sp.]